MDSRNTKRFTLLMILTLLAFVVPAAAEAPDPNQDQCFQQCAAMEAGCPVLGGTLYGSCSYNPGAPSPYQCTMPGCYCMDRPNYICGDDLPIDQ